MAWNKSGMETFHGLTQKCAVNHILLYSCLYFLLFLSVHSKDILIEFSQIEEQNVGQPVGSVSSSPVILQMVDHKVRSGLRYSILPDGNDNSNMFKIDAISGNITFARKVDRENVCPLSRLCELNFGVAVSGGNNFFRRIPVKVGILDINDNSPLFPDPATVVIRISEDAPETVSHTLPVASDADSSVEFGVHSYKIDPPSDTFRLVSSGNFLGISQVTLVLSKKLDREDAGGYQLVVVAQDGGQPANSGSLIVNVIVEDVNDNQPTFVQKIYSVDITEDAGRGDEILTVSASDNDIGDNGRVVYTLASPGSGNLADIVEKISINASTGVVTLTQPLVNGEYRFWLDAHDLGSPRRYDQALVSLTVLDTINNQPTVRMNPVQKDNLPLDWLPEGLEVNTVVAVVTVDDPDSDNNGHVTCQSEDSHFLLESLEANRYKMMIAQTLDREINATYTAIIACHDHGQPRMSATASMLLHVEDINDNPPQFRQESYMYNIVENNMRGDTVAFITASDRDEGQNAVMTYKLTNDGGNFNITPNTGIITANRKFDRELVAQYTFQVLAVDHGEPALAGTATVTVNILDVNDNDPVFSLQEYHFRIYENRQPGSSVGNISVTDSDLGDGGSISLSLKPNDENDVVPFAIDFQGRISNLQTFDRETKNIYRFSVVATDNGPQKRSSSVQVVVHILDINDNAPVFIFPSERNYSTTLNMPIRKDAVILHVDVYDSDENQNGLVIHSMVDNNASQLFMIGTFSGHLVSRKDFNSPDVAGSYYLIINATDQGSPPLWQTRTLHLILQSESISSDDVIADQNLLIVSCIICFTVIVSGVVLVAICLVRSQDRRKKIHYHASVCRDLPADANCGLTSDSGKQYTLQTAKMSHEQELIDQTPSYHQQEQQHNHSNSYSNTVYNLNKSADSSMLGSRCNTSHVFVSSTQKLEGLDTSRHRQDDFNSTASAETGTGDSGHGSDEEISNSAEHAGLPPSLDGHCVSLTPAVSKQRKSAPDISQRRSSQQHGVLQPSALKTSRLRANSCSVRFDPHVTDIYDHRHPLRSQPHHPPIRGRSSSVPCSVLPQNQPHAGDFLKHRFQQPFSIHQQQYGQSKAGLPYQADNDKPANSNYPGERFNTPSLSSLGDSCNEDSDLNTTTSGSYSVVSEKMFQIQDFGVSSLRDRRV